MSDIEDDPPPVLLPCTVCSRTFRPEVLERHVKVCEKTASKKRRVFDSFKNRVSGTELEEFLGPAPLPGQAPKRPVKSPVKKKSASKWKETHENLIAVLRAARGVESASDTMLEAPKPAGNEQCPSCNRFFGPRAFDRHVEFCKEKTARIKMTPSKVSQAQERLEARTKYRAPLSIKPKLTTKEKYSPMLPRKDSTESCATSTKTSPPIPALNRNLKSGKQISSGFSRQSPVRNSERQRSVSPTKKSVASSSKSNAKTEGSGKTSNHPKIKENLKSPDDLRPKTGTKLTTQEKIRNSNVKPSQLEDETHRQITRAKGKKTRERITAKSDSESVGTVESETGEEKGKRSRWASSESVRKPTRKSGIKALEEKCRESEKIVLELGSKKLEGDKHKTRVDSRSGKRSSKQNPQINDLSVNDESFGIFVAACSQKPSFVARIPEESPRTNKREKELKPFTIAREKELKPSQTVNNPKESPVKNPRKPKTDIKVKEPDEDQTENQMDQKLEAVTDLKTTKLQKIGGASRIPKAKPEIIKSHREKAEKVEETIEYDKRDSSILECSHIDEVGRKESESTQNETTGGEEFHEETYKRKSRKWRNIADIPTEDLVHMSEDFNLTEDEPSQELSESAIWEIAGEQFLKSEESVQSTSVISIDSLESGEKKAVPSKINSGGDDFIVLHVTDPAKLLENDADMKLSISEPCFPYSNKVHRRKDVKSDNQKIDIVVFTAVPNAIQTKLSHRRRRWRRKVRKPKSAPKMMPIRERTFLANEIPKPKRRKTGDRESRAPRVDISEFKFGASSTEELEERKKKFIEGLKNQREKIRKWQITANSHMRFMEEFHKGMEDDLRELKSLFNGRKPRRKPPLREYVKEKMKKLKEESEKKKLMAEVRENKKKFEYFEINLDEEPPGGVEDKQEERRDDVPEKKFELSTSDSGRRLKRGNNEINPPGGGNELLEPNSEQSINHPNSSLENIEEVDETAEELEETVEEENDKPEEEKCEEESTCQKDIDIEDFIISKPNAQKILSKNENCLDQLFPKPRKILETVTKGESTTAVRLEYTADSVYDLKEKKLPQVSARGSSTRILQKRMRRGSSHLPKILVKNNEKKENSMISLIELWKNKNGPEKERETTYKTKATLPAGKLAPLANKNSFQIAVLPVVLKRKLSKMIEERLREGDSNESYDPFKQAERQMLALLSWPSTVDMQKAKDTSPKPKPNPQQKSNLETSPTSAFTKYPNKEDKSNRNARKSLNETFEVEAKKNARNEKPTYSAADDWEEIFEKHFDLNRNEMTDQMTRSVKSALDGFLKNSLKNSSNASEELSSSLPKNNQTDNSIITEVLYTSTPKQKSERNSRSRESTIDLDKTPNTYRKSSNYGRITPSEDFNDSHGKGKKEEKPNRNSGISLSSLSFCSQISDTTLADEEVMRSNLEIIGKAAAAAASRTPRRKYARSQSVFDERNKMLFAQTYDPNVSSSDENDVATKPGKKSPSRNPHPKSVPSHIYRSQSVMEDRCKGDGDHSDDGDHSPESNRNRKAKLSGDSAYSSLNRRSPRANPQQNQQEDRLSSSGSEHSLPTIGNNEFEPKPKSLDFGAPKKDHPVKMSKFCHECGSKYPVAVAKFCCECGVRRLII